MAASSFDRLGGVESFIFAAQFGHCPLFETLAVGG
jgi:hypothetical protein